LIIVMIQKESVVYAADNSGAKFLKCVAVFKKRNAFAIIGNTVLVSVKIFVHRKKLKKTEIYFGLLVTAKQYTYRTGGLAVKFCSNRILVFSKQFKFLGTRIYGGISKDIRIKLNSGALDKKKYYKVVAYTSLVV
jgi:large subunit ribosomal protein L14